MPERILLVEDNNDHILLTKIALKRASDSYQLESVNNAENCLKKLAEKEYDLLLVDIRTPVMNGKQLFQWITEEHPELANRVILTTGELFGSASEEFIEQSGRPFLPKPFTPDVLTATVREAMRTRENDA